MERITFADICNALPLQYDDKTRIWSDGEEILCRTDTLADSIADLLEALKITDCAVTGYYDPKEDKEINMVDSYTGWHYVSV